MVNRELRGKGALLIRRFLASEATNDDLADFPRDRDDPALRAIGQRLWFHYGDLRVHYCNFPLDSPVGALFQRCALFLDTSYEYEWPDLGHHNLAHPIISVLTGELFRLRAIARAKRTGDYTVWPFFRKADFESAKTEFRQGDITGDDDFPELPPGLFERVRLSVSIIVAVLQAIVFFAAGGSAVYAILVDLQWWMNAILLFVVYLFLLGIGMLVGISARTAHPQGSA